jgi:Transglutaminase-like superfamily
MTGVDARAWFAAPEGFSAIGDARIDIAVDADGVPDIAAVVQLVRGLLVYDVVAKLLYGVDLSTEFAETIHVRHMRELVEKLGGCEPRPVSERAGARCRTYALLTVAFLRSVGVPARARCGFGAYFNRGRFEDHWVAEYWHAREERWVMVDAQIDEQWTAMLSYQGNALDVRPDEFIVAGRAWTAWRNGEIDADLYGLSAINEQGAFWIAGNLRLDFAALNKVEMLPWDLWGAGWEPHEPIPEDLSLFDTMALLTADADEHLEQIQALYQSNDGVRMPGTVFNVLRQRLETV